MHCCCKCFWWHLSCLAYARNYYSHCWFQGCVCTKRSSQCSQCMTFVNRVASVSQKRIIVADHSSRFYITLENQESCFKALVVIRKSKEYRLEAWQKFANDFCITCSWIVNYDRASFWYIFCFDSKPYSLPNSITKRKTRKPWVWDSASKLAARSRRSIGPERGNMVYNALVRSFVGIYSEHWFVLLLSASQSASIL